MLWRRVHWVVGTATLVLFLLSGAYMRWLRTPAVSTLPDLTRSLYRSRHLFLLLVALANLTLSANSDSTRRPVRFAMVLLLVAPLLLFSAFFVEPTRGLGDSLLAAPAMYILFLAAVILVFEGRRG